jgi:hypothetical protein
MKYCEDCKWWYVGADSAEESTCDNELSRRNGLDCVSREIEILAYRARDIYGNCGPEGKLWEAKDA